MEHHESAEDIAAEFCIHPSLLWQWSAKASRPGGLRTQHRTGRPDEQDWKDEDPYNPERAAVWKEAPDGPVSYVSIPSVWPADWCDSDEEDPGLVGDISAVTGDGSAAAAARERHQIEFEMDADSVEEGDDMGNGASDEGEAAGSGSGAE